MHKGSEHMIFHQINQLASTTRGATSTSSSTANVVILGVLALYYPLVKLLRSAPHSEVTRPCVGDDT